MSDKPYTRTCAAASHVHSGGRNPKCFTCASMAEDKTPAPYFPVRSQAAQKRETVAKFLENLSDTPYHVCLTQADELLSALQRFA